MLVVNWFTGMLWPCTVLSILWNRVLSDSPFLFLFCKSVHLFVTINNNNSSKNSFVHFKFVETNFTSCLLLISWPSLLMSGNWICDNLSFVNLCFTLMLSCWRDIYKCSGEFMMITTGGLAMSQECTCHLLDSTWPPDIT